LLTILIPRVESAQINIFSYTGTETTFTLGPGTYDITAYGAQGGDGLYGGGGYGAEMEARFSLTAATNLTILVGGAGSFGLYGGGGGGGSFVVNGSTPLVIAGGGGGGDLAGGGLPGGVGGGSNDYYGEFGNGGYGGGGGGGGVGGVISRGSVGGGSFGGYCGGGGGGGGYGGGYGFWGGAGGGPTGGDGGGSYIDSSSIPLEELSGVQSGNGEVMITAIPESPAYFAELGAAALGFAAIRRRRRVA